MKEEATLSRLSARGPELDAGSTPAPPANQSRGDVQIRDRIKTLRRVRAGDLLINPKNWRRHPKAQADALRGLLEEIGYADALIGRELQDGRLMLIDGHLRAETTPDAEVPVLVLDVSEQEADKILLTLDPLAAMAESDAERIKALLQAVGTESQAVEEPAQAHGWRAAVANTPSRRIAGG